MNPVLILTHNNLELTKRCIDSIWQQTVDVHLIIVDNGSTDGTDNFSETHGIELIRLRCNAGVSIGWNVGIKLLSLRANAHHVLVVGNDTWLPPDFYRTLLSCDKPFVTGVAVDNMEQANQTPGITPYEPHPDFSAFLIRRDCWERVGQFNERMKHYCSDCDYHIRAHRMGIEMVKAAVPFYHERSSTLRLAPPEEAVEIQAQANKDREVFRSIYNCLPGTREYEELFK